MTEAICGVAEGGAAGELATVGCPSAFSAPNRPISPERTPRLTGFLSVMGAASPSWSASAGETISRRHVLSHQSLPRTHAHADGGHGGLGPVGHAELAKHCGQVRLHRLLREEQRSRDLTVAPALCQQGQDVGLALGEVLGPRSARFLRGGLVFLRSLEQAADGSGRQDVPAPRHRHPDGLVQVLGARVFQHVAVGAVGQGLLDVLSPVVAGQHDHGDLGPRRLDLPKQLEPIAPRHPHVEQRDVDGLRLQQLHGVVGAGGFQDLGVGKALVDHVSDPPADQRVVVDDQDLHRSSSPTGRRAITRVPSRRADSTDTVPPTSATRFSIMSSPKFLRGPPPCTPWGLNPLPVSRTSTASSVFVTRMDTETVPAPECFAALASASRMTTYATPRTFLGTGRRSPSTCTVAGSRHRSITSWTYFVSGSSSSTGCSSLLRSWRVSRSSDSDLPSSA